MHCRLTDRRRSRTAPSIRGRIFSRCLAVAWLTAIATFAQAESLGDARQLSHVGEPLRLSVAILPDGAPPLEPTCLAVVAPRQSDGLPHILTARVAVERQPAAAAVMVTTSSPLREPVVRLLLRTDCTGATRLYTLFLEPPGSARIVRVPGQSAASTRAAEAGPGAATGTAASAPGVTVIPVQPGVPTRADPSASLASTSATAAIAASAKLDVGAPASNDPVVLEAENQVLKQRLAQLNGELQRLQQSAAPVPGDAAANAPSGGSNADNALSPRWDIGLTLGIALLGLAAVMIGGLVWRRRHIQDWPLTGPPSHRLASRTSLAEEPVPFKPSGTRSEPVDESRKAPPQVERRPRAAARRAPDAVFLQPSADDLGRELEQELAAAARAHSALERAHPEIVEALARCWGTASARAELASLLAPNSSELARMSGEAVAELKLLQRIAEDIAQRPGAHPRSPMLGPAAPAW